MIGRARHPHEIKDIAQPGSRHPIARVERPPRPFAANAHDPAPIMRQINERKGRQRRNLHLIARADHIKIIKDLLIGGHHQVIAIVDPRAELGIVERPAAPAQMPRHLQQGHGPPSSGEAHRRRQPGHPAADHQSRPCRSVASPHAPCRSGGK